MTLTAYTRANNKLIAEFMGLNLIDNRWIKETDDGKVFIGFEFEGGDSDLKYNSSWDWLMPVVEKIESLDKIDGTIYRVTICDEVCKIDTTNREIAWTRYATKIQSTYYSVIEFINWYNKQ